METKTVVKVISLYDYIADNLLILLATIHHIFIVAFNYYYIHLLDEYTSQEEGNQVFYENLQTTLEFCQEVTLFTFVLLFIVIVANNDAVQLNQNRVIIMFISYVIKTVYCFSQFLHNQKEYTYFKKLLTNENHNIKMKLLVLSFEIRVLAPMIVVLMRLNIWIIDSFISVMKSIVNFTKNYKFTVLRKVHVQTEHKY